jgi:hypothetical protein
MLHTDCYLAERLMDLRVQEERHQAELRLLQREAQSAHQGRLSRHSCWVLCQLGSLFVSLGVRLLHTGLPQPRPAGERMLIE